MSGLCIPADERLLNFGTGAERKPEAFRNGTKIFPQLLRKRLIRAPQRFVAADLRHF